MSDKDSEERKQQSEDCDKSQSGQNTSRSEDDEAAKKKKEYIKEELGRLENSLQREYSKVKQPEVREHFPYIFTSPYPYCNTEVARYVINMPDGEVSGRGYKSRSTAVGLCDPETDHKMDTTNDFDLVRLPQLKRGETRQGDTPRGGEGSEKGGEKRPPKEGSTRLPKFPAVSLDSKDLSSKTLYYNDVPHLRTRLRERYDKNNDKKLREDYNRTRNDIYRMELDRFDQLHPKSRPLMRKCYFAYLQNTRGSKKAIYECLKSKN